MISVGFSVVLIAIVSVTIYMRNNMKSLNSSRERNPLMNPRYSVRENFYGDFGPLKGMEISDHAFPVNSMKRNSIGRVNGLIAEAERISTVENQAFAP
jgi:hypothetical protein